MIKMKSDIKKVHVKCNSCNSEDTEFVTSGSEHEYDNTTDDIFCMVKCKQCGLYYLNPRPDVCELKTIYPDNYYAYNLQAVNQEVENRNSLLFRARKFVYLKKLIDCLKLCPRATRLKVLDIGCADGRALNWYRQIKDFDIETYGVDFDQQAVEKARSQGHRVYLGRFEEADIPEGTFDLAVATHVIEHVADPKGFASKVYRILKPGGIFLCETPNCDSLDARWFAKKHWGGYHFPRHWVLYSPKSIRALAQSIGFDLLRIDYYPAPAFWNWTLHSLVKSVGKMNEDGGATADRTGRALSGRIADALFPPVDFQKNNLRNLLAVSTFTLLDLAIKLCTGQTSNMSVVLRKPTLSD